MAAVQIRQEALDRLDRARDAAVARAPAQRATLDAIRDDGARQVAAAADLGRCEDNDPSTGVAADSADLRQRLAIVVDAAVQRLDAPPAPPAPAKNEKGKSGHR